MLCTERMWKQEAQNHQKASQNQKTLINHLANDPEKALTNNNTTETADEIGQIKGHHTISVTNNITVIIGETLHMIDGIPMMIGIGIGISGIGICILGIRIIGIGNLSIGTGSISIVAILALTFLALALVTLALAALALEWQYLRWQYWHWHSWQWQYWHWHRCHWHY